LHTIDLGPSLQEVFQGFDRDSVQRRIERAERAGLTEKCGNTTELLDDFFDLFVVTRRRHRIPPSPYAWFRNLIDCMGEALQIRIAYRNGTPVTAILTMRFKKVVYYKYGCSDSQFNTFGATPWLIWRAITAAKDSGAASFDLGRTQAEHQGLLTFKNHWDHHPSELLYLRYPECGSQNAPDPWKSKIAGRAFSLMPDPLFKFAGAMLYRHIG